MRRKHAALVVAALLAVVILASGPSVVRYEQVTIRALDAETEKPLRGIVVAARWRTASRWCFHGTCENAFIRRAETVTDDNGAAVFPTRSVVLFGWKVLRDPEVVCFTADRAVLAPWKDAVLFRTFVDASDEIDHVEEGLRMVSESSSEVWCSSEFPRLATEVARARSRLPALHATRALTSATPN